MTAFNFSTLAEYGGKNATIEGNGELPAFATFNQLKSLGYMVRKGAKGVRIFCGYREKREGDKVTRIPRTATVFDIIDTTAIDDKDFIKWLKEQVSTGKIKQYLS